MLTCERAKPFQVSPCAQSQPTLCDPVDGSPPGSSVNGIFQARILEWVVISFFIVSPTLQADSLPTELQGKLKREDVNNNNKSLYVLSEFHLSGTVLGNLPPGS